MRSNYGLTAQLPGLGSLLSTKVGEGGSQAIRVSWSAQQRGFHVTRQIIQTSDAPSSALFSQAIKVGSTIYTSGITGIDPTTNQPAASTIQEQTRRALVNCENILRAAGAKLESVVEVHVLLARPNDFAGFNEEYAKFFSK
jgi:reactive intermediate/imine deaminase